MGKVLENIDLTVAQHKEIVELLKNYLPNTEVWVYGSRVKFTAKASSDLDIVAFASKDQRLAVANLKEAFEESSLPFRVDLFIWDEVPEEFHENIEFEYVVLQNRKNATDFPRGWRSSTWGEEISLEYGKRLQGYRDGIGNYCVYGSNGPVGWTAEPLVPGPGVILGRKGANRGIEFSKEPFFVIDTAYYVRLNTELDMRWVYYAIKYYKLGEINDGSPIPSTTRSAVYVRKVILPNYLEQRAIARILGSLDDKIELNRRMNETLEAMAQALFKSWFVDFDPVIDNALAAGNEIPEELQKKAKTRQALGSARKPLPEKMTRLFPSEFEYTDEMGWIPRGWRACSLDDLVNLIGGGTPKTSISEYWGGDIPWFSVVDAPNISDVFVVDTEKHVTQLGVEKSSTKILPIGTTIISARGTVGKCAMAGVPIAMNQSCYGVRGKKGVPDSFVYYAIREKVADLQRGGHGSVFNTITRTTFQSIKIAFGKPELSEKLEEKIRPNFDKILKNRLQTRTLSNLRDTLLPKLISGELRLSPEAIATLGAEDASA